MTNTSTADGTEPGFFCELPDYTILSVRSIDNLKFLQGQFTCDLREVSSNAWRYGALCTPQGRMVGNFLLAEWAPNHHLLRLPKSAAEAVATTLNKFAPFYKGAVTDDGADFVLYGLVGGDRLPKFLPTLPTGSNGCALVDDTLQLRLDESRYECWVRRHTSGPFRQKLQEAFPEQPASAWDLLTVRRGLGEVRGQTVETWTPHMLNLPAIGAVNFKKGCYTGQEIVARTEYRGHQKRAMYRVESSGTVPEPGTEILDETQRAGEIVLASPAGPDGRWEALAVIGDSHIDHTLTCEQHALRLLDLPYPVTRNR